MAGDLLDHLQEQDVVTFTGSSSTGQALRIHPNIVAKSIPFNLEADSLNCCILGQSITGEDPEFDLFVGEIYRELTTKAGQRCTAIRRVIVPAERLDHVVDALRTRLADVAVGDPSADGVQMGSLLGASQKAEVQAGVSTLAGDCELVLGGTDDFPLVGDNAVRAAFYPPTVLVCPNPLQNSVPHTVEAFGPVCTVMPYNSADEAVQLASLGKGSLVGSVFTNDDDEASAIVLGTAAWHGRMLVINRDCGRRVNRTRIALAQTGSRRARARRGRRGAGWGACRKGLHAAHLGTRLAYDIDGNDPSAPRWGEYAPIRRAPVQKTL